MKRQGETLKFWVFFSNQQGIADRAAIHKIQQSECHRRNGPNTKSEPDQGKPNLPEESHTPSTTTSKQQGNLRTIQDFPHSYLLL